MGRNVLLPIFYLLIFNFLEFKSAETPLDKIAILMI